MVVVFLRAKNQELSISLQQDYIIDYATENGIAIDNIKVDDSVQKSMLEERDNLFEFLKSLHEKDIVIIYDLWVLSKRVGELTKIFSCLLKRDIKLHIAKRKYVIDLNTPIIALMELLSKERERNLNKDKNSLGRPKGSFSKSKFDKHKNDILVMLDNGFSVSKIAKNLNICRSSLKDYINSRGLKEIVNSQKINQNIKKLSKKTRDIEIDKKCALLPQKG